MPYLTIAPSPLGGRGVYATEDIPAGTVIEISPVVVLSPKERVEVEKTKLFNYIFEWGEGYKSAAVALGYVSMYNHSYHASCEYEMDFDREDIRITTVKAIAAGDEITINYNADPDDTTPLWFAAK